MDYRVHDTQVSRGTCVWISFPFSYRTWPRPGQTLAVTQSNPNPNPSSPTWSQAILQAWWLNLLLKVLETVRSELKGEGYIKNGKGTRLKSCHWLVDAEMPPIKKP